MTCTHSPSRWSTKSKWVWVSLHPSHRHLSMFSLNHPQKNWPILDGQHPGSSQTHQPLNSAIAPSALQRFVLPKVDSGVESLAAPSHSTRRKPSHVDIVGVTAIYHSQWFPSRCGSGVFVTSSCLLVFAKETWIRGYVFFLERGKSVFRRRD